MKRVLTFEILADSPVGDSLVKLAEILRGWRIEPEAFAWSRPPGGNIAFVRLTLRPADADQAQELRTKLRGTVDVVHVTLSHVDRKQADSPPRASTPPLAAPMPPDAPFAD